MLDDYISLSIFDGCTVIAQQYKDEMPEIMESFAEGSHKPLLVFCIVMLIGIYSSCSVEVTRMPSYLIPIERIFNALEKVSGKIYSTLYCYIALYHS